MLLKPVTRTAVDDIRNSIFRRGIRMMSHQGDAYKMLKENGPFIYGTAWKKDNTTRLMKDAISAGFRAFDTAAQPKHYREDLVGIALRNALEDSTVKREQIFVRLSCFQIRRIAHLIHHMIKHRFLSVQ
jgi:diketogulonate reductase-like aldo/keto reductase